MQSQANMCLFCSKISVFCFQGFALQRMEYIMFDQGNFIIRYDLFDEPRKYEDHYHNAHEIIFIEEGEADFLISGKKYAAGKNSIIFINNFESHKSTITKYPYKRYFILLDQKYLHFAITDPVLLSVFKQRPSLFEHKTDLACGSGDKIRQYIQEIYREYNSLSRHSEDMVIYMLNLIVISLYRLFPQYFPGYSTGENYETIDKIEKYIESNYEKNILLSETAKLFNCNMHYLSHLFKEITGYGFKEYLINQRMSKAKELLLKTNFSIGEVCVLCGFKNVNHFIRMFKQKEAVTPLKFRKKQ